MPESTLRATYTSPSFQKDFSMPLSAPLPPSNSPTAVKDKVAYLSQLRASTKQLQEDINMFLTQKMEEDKVAAAAAEGQNGMEHAGKRGAGREKSKEQVEEENYGEERTGVEEDG